MNVFTIQAGAEGLQNYLQNTETEVGSTSLADSTPIAPIVPIVKESAVVKQASSTPFDSNESILKIIELVVAGVVASALIISSQEYVISLSPFCQLSVTSPSPLCYLSVTRPWECCH
jgi:hypothetical protein